MDTITHIVLGACIGEVIAGNKIGKKALLFGAIINNIPDSDVICYLWMSPSEALLAHRGITHSLFLNVLLSFFLAYFLKKIFKNYALSFYQWLLLVSSGLFTHIFLDLFNAYGMGLFEPFNSTRISFNSLFIIDPLFTLPLLITAIALLILRNGHTIRLKIATISLLLSSLYLMLCLVNKIDVDNITEKSVLRLEIPSTDYFTSPTPFNNLLWYIVVKDKKQFLIGYYSIFDKDLIIHFEKINKNDSLLTPYKNTKDIQNLIHFSQGYYCMTNPDSSVVFNDLRFGQENGWNKSNASFNFRFDLQKDQKNLFLVQRGRYKNFNWKSISGLLSRIAHKDLQE